MIGSNCSIDMTQNILNRQEQPPETIDVVRNVGSIGSFVTTATSLARKSKLFEPMHRATNDKMKMRNYLMAEPEEMLHQLNIMDQASKDRINAVLEYLRLSRTAIRDTGRPFSIKTRELREEGADGIERRVQPALSKPGQVLKLNKKESEMLFKVRDFLDTRYTQNAKSILAAVGYTGPYNRAGIESTIDDEDFRQEVLSLFSAIEKQRITSYIPFMRSGDTRVLVYGPDKTLDTGAFYMLDSLDWVKSLVGPTLGSKIPNPNVDAKIKEIRQKYPTSEGYKVVVTKLGANPKDRLSIEDLSTLDKLLNLMDARSGEIIKDYFDRSMGGMFSEQALRDVNASSAAAIAKGFIADLDKSVRSVLMKDLTAGFMKQSRNIAGYDTNFTDRLLDYNRITAATISHRMYREEYARAFDKLKRQADDPEKNYAENWDNYVDTPEHVIWRAARTAGFFNAMWGSFASSAVNAMSVWTVTAPQMTLMKASAGLDVYKEALKVMAGFRGAVGYGLHIDPKAIPGLTQDEREALILANQRGSVRAQMNPELMGMESGLALTRAGPLKKTFDRYFQYGSSVVSITEEMNKAAAFIVAYRYAKDPRAMANWREAFADNERAKAIMERGATPFDVAEFMVESATFMGGQIEKPPILRGFGGVALQFSQYPLQIMATLNQNFRKQGKRGKIAGMFTLMTMFTVSGLLFAIPFGDDAINIFEFLYRNILGKKVDFRTETQELLADYLGNGEEGRRDAETILYGPFRTLLGLNIGERIGFSSMLPEFDNVATAIPALSGTIGRFQEYIDRRNSGVQPIAAYITLASPFIGKGPTDILKGFLQYPEEGLRTRYGTLTKPAEEMDLGEQIARGFGFQSASIARQRQAAQAGKEINESTRNAERNLTLRLSKLLADSVRAEEAGDAKKAAKLEEQFNIEMEEAVAQFEKDVNAGNMEDAIKPPSSQTLRESVMIELNPELRLNSVGKLKREAYLNAYRTLMVEEDPDDLFLEEEEYGGDEELATPMP